MQSFNSGFRISKAMAAASLCLASVAPVAANAAVRPSVKPIATVTLAGSKACAADKKDCRLSLMPTRAGASVAKSDSNILGLALLPLLGLAAAVTIATVVVATSGDDPASPGS